ncbi:BtpA/SgcQ family protein [Myxococcota bacterium]|nr:BtpA/SgcQ family protein [Myxococcota bacterium]
MKRALFGVPRALIGMVHVGALPGTPAHGAPLRTIIAQAVAEARLYRDAGYDVVLIENMHDRPYRKGGVGPEIVAAMTAVGCAVRAAVDLPLGVQILAGANHEALAVALACEARFVRVEGFVFAHVADEGVIEACAADLLRYRRALGADVAVVADIKKKHSAHAITADVSLVETAHAAEFFLADGLIVTGTATGHAADPAEVAAVAAAVNLPVLVGSGASAENVGAYAAADGVIVGSSVKVGGRWEAPVDAARARAFAEAFRRG